MAVRLTARAFAAALGLAAGVAQAAPQPLWTLDGFANPESAVYAKEQELIYVSNVNGEPAAKDHNGFISRVSPAGKLVQREWLKGLNAPKGLALYHGILYVADIDELLEVDTGNGKVRARYKGAGGKFFNDVAVDGGGRVYVSDTATNTIWRLAGTTFAPLVSDPGLVGPNGLVVENGRLVVAGWSATPGGAEAPGTGYLSSVDLKSNAVEPRFAPIPLGNLDGLLADGKGGYLVSDWVHGELYKVSPTGEAVPWLLLDQGIADIGWLPPKRVLVPNMKAGTLSAYPLD